MIYLDANVFVYAATDDGPKGRAAARRLRTALKQGAATASLTVDEVLWAIHEKLGREAAAAKARQLLLLDLQVEAVGADDVREALAHFAAGLAPRDAIHAAVALRLGCRTIVSTDGDFDRVRGLRRTGY